MGRNYMDMIPVRNIDNTWKSTDENLIVIYVQCKGIYNRFTNSVLKAPKVKEIELDFYGSYVWNLIDGERTIMEICNEIASNLGEDKELSMKRLAVFMQMLKIHKMIMLK